MKKVLLILPIISLFFGSCYSEMGPPGPPGPPGQDGINILGQIFEAQIDFDAANNYRVLVDFPDNIDVYDTDIVIAYILSGTDNGMDIWEPLPQTLFFEEGILLYGFNYTLVDIEFLLDGSVSLDDLMPSYTQGIIYRVAIIPAEAAENIDLNKMSNVLNSFNNEDIIKLN